MARKQVINERRYIVHKYRRCDGMATYNIISGVFGVASTLHLRDTSCNHSGPNCEIEVKICDNGNCYEFSKVLNWTAEEHVSFHRLEKFWATKEEAYIEVLHLNIESNVKYIADDLKHLEKDEAKLAGIQEKEVRYFTSDMAEIGATCYLETDGVTRIIGTILFEDGTAGYLTDNNYLDEGDRIILIEKENRIETERGDVVFVSGADFDNYKENNAIERIKKSINIYKKSIERSERENNLLNSIIDRKDSLTYEQMVEMRKGEKN
jgi:hypothetical protein